MRIAFVTVGAVFILAATSTGSVKGPSGWEVAAADHVAIRIGLVVLGLLLVGVAVVDVWTTIRRDARNAEQERNAAAVEAAVDTQPEMGTYLATQVHARVHVPGMESNDPEPPPLEIRAADYDPPSDDHRFYRFYDRDGRTVREIPRTGVVDIQRRDDKPDDHLLL